MEYERVKQHDILSSAVVARPGRSVAISVAQAVRRKAHPNVIAHVRKWGMEHTLATARVESPLNVFTVVSLYRRDRRGPGRIGVRAERGTAATVDGWKVKTEHVVGSTGLSPASLIPLNDRTTTASAFRT